jgi:hypothetical protein
MAINMKDLNKLAKFARKNGITSLKVDGIEIQVNVSFLDQPVGKADLSSDVVLPQPYTDEQIINWSSTTYVEAN